MNINLFYETLILQQGKCRFSPSIRVFNSAEKSVKNRFDDFYNENEKKKKLAVTMTISDLEIDTNDNNKSSSLIHGYN